MSAAEKLNQLERSMGASLQMAPIDQVRRYRDALPQIVAVVEVAEYVRDGWLIIEADDAHLMNAIALLDPALAALDEKLNGAEHSPSAERT